MEENYSGEKSVIETKADSVDYNSDGKYTTKLTVKKAEFTGITADNVQVIYSVLNEDGYAIIILNDYINL